MLDLSKLLMLEFHYDFVKRQYPGTKSTLAFTDTDSLLYEIETDDIYADMRQHHEQFDLSNYPDDHRIFRNDDTDTIKWLKSKNKNMLNYISTWLFPVISSGWALYQVIGLGLGQRPRDC